MESGGPPEQCLLDAADHPVSPLVNHAATPGVPITVPKGVTKREQDKALRYGSHAYVVREVYFVHQELAEQIQAGHIVVFPWDAISN